MMQNLDCRSLFRNRNTDYGEVRLLIEKVRKSLNAFKTEQGKLRFQSFEIPEQLVIPLEHLDDLFATLFMENGSWLSDVQRKYLTICETLVASCFCYIYRFIELHDGAAAAIREDYVRKLAYEFYYNAAYELRTPVSSLKGYSEPQILSAMGVDSPPFVPTNQDKFDKIGYWLDELWKFIEELPKLWKANEEENAA